MLAISPDNKILIGQLRSYAFKKGANGEYEKFEKGNDDAVDSLIAGAQPVAKRHRAHLDDVVNDNERRAALGAFDRRSGRVAAEG